MLRFLVSILYVIFTIVGMILLCNNDYALLSIRNCPIVAVFINDAANCMNQFLSCSLIAVLFHNLNYLFFIIGAFIFFEEGSKAIWPAFRCRLEDCL